MNFFIPFIWGLFNSMEYLEAILFWCIPKPKRSSERSQNLAQYIACGADNRRNLFIEVMEWLNYLIQLPLTWVPESEMYL